MSSVVGGVVASVSSCGWAMIDMFVCVPCVGKEWDSVSQMLAGSVLYGATYRRLQDTTTWAFLDVQSNKGMHLMTANESDVRVVTFNNSLHLIFCFVSTQSACNRVLCRPSGLHGQDTMHLNRI